MQKIITHPGTAHKDEFLSCCLLISKYKLDIFRQEPTEDDLRDPKTIVLDIGGEYSLKKNNFDHHQFEKDHPPICSLSLVFKKLDLYEQAQKCYPWLSIIESFDSKGLIKTSRWLGVNKKTLNKLNSPIDIILLKEFSKKTELTQSDLLWKLMKIMGDDLFDYLNDFQSNIDYISKNSQILNIEKESSNLSALYLPRVEDDSEINSSAIFNYLKGINTIVDCLIYPDRRNEGYALAKYLDSEKLDFNLIVNQEDVHFSHKQGFISKTSATSLPRLIELVKKSIII